MVNRQSVTFTIIITSIFLTYTAVYASELNKFNKSNEFIVMQSKQYDEQKDYTATPYKDSSCNHKKRAHKKHGNKKRNRGKHSYAHIVAMHADELSLSDAQLGRLIRLHKKHSQEYKKIKKNMYKNMKNLNYSGMSLGTDDSFLQKLGDEHLDIFNSLLEQHIRNRRVVNTILTDEQKNKLNGMKIDNGNQSCLHSSA